MQIFLYYIGTFEYVKKFNIFSGIYFGKRKTFVFLYLESKKSKIVNNTKNLYKVFRKAKCIYL